MTETINIGDCHYKQTSTFKDRLLDEKLQAEIEANSQRIITPFEEDADINDYGVVESDGKSLQINYENLEAYLNNIGFIRKETEYEVEFYKFNFKTGYFDRIQKDRMFDYICQLFRKISVRPRIPTSFKTSLESMIYPNLTKTDEMVPCKEFEELKKFYTDGEVIPFLNGFYSMRYNRFLPRTSCIFEAVPLEVEFNPQALHNKISARYSEMMIDDCEYEFLFEQLGYQIYATSKMRLPTCTILYGSSGSNGKSVVAESVKRIVGAKNTSSVSLENMTDKHERADCYGKKMNLVMDAGKGYSDSAYRQIADIALFIKSATNYEPVNVNPKYAKPGMKVVCPKFLFASNNYLNFGDTSGGMDRRIYIIPFTKHFEQNDAIAQEFVEKEAIEWFAMRSLIGYFNVINNAMNGAEFEEGALLHGKYIECQFCTDAKAKAKAYSSAFASFLAEEHGLDVMNVGVVREYLTHELPDRYDIYEEMKAYCDRYGRGKVKVDTLKKELEYYSLDCIRKTYRDNLTGYGHYYAVVPISY